MMFQFGFTAVEFGELVQLVGDALKARETGHSERLSTLLGMIGGELDRLGLSGLYSAITDTAGFPALEYLDSMLRSILEGLEQAAYGPQRHATGVIPRL